MYSFVDREFKAKVSADASCKAGAVAPTVHLSLTGSLLSALKGDEVAEQRVAERLERTAMEERRCARQRAEAEAASATEVEAAAGSASGARMTAPADVDADGANDLLLQRNQFTYAERAVSVSGNGSKSRAACTEPPRTEDVAGEMSQWRMHDAYAAEARRAAAAASASAVSASPVKTDAAGGSVIGGVVSSGGGGEGGVGSLASSTVVGLGGIGSSGSGSGNVSGGGARAAASAAASAAAAAARAAATRPLAAGVGGSAPAMPAGPMYTPEIARALKVVVRLVSENANDELYADLRYYEDPADGIQPEAGSCLPLWKFEDARTAKRQVTALAANNGYADVFAVGYGSYDVLRQGSGCVTARARVRRAAACCNA